MITVRRVRHAPILISLAVILFPGAAAAQDWGPLQFLMGRWTAEGNAGDRANGKGWFEFAPALDGKILVRKNFAEYPAGNGKPAFKHEDLLIVFRDGPSQQLRASFFDSEGHVIQYSVRALGGGVVFVSDGAQTEPRYRLTYTSTGSDRLKLKFEIAPPGKDFATYIETTARRESGENPS